MQVAKWPMTFELRVNKSDKHLWLEFLQCLAQGLLKLLLPAYPLFIHGAYVKVRFYFKPLFFWSPCLPIFPISQRSGTTFLRAGRGLLALYITETHYNGCLNTVTHLPLKSALHVPTSNYDQFTDWWKGTIFK